MMNPTLELSLEQCTGKLAEYQAGTREWIFRHIQAWMDLNGAQHGKAEENGSARRVFVLLGYAGVGKSVLAAELVRRYHGMENMNRGDGKSKGRWTRKWKKAGNRKAERSARVIGFHFFQHDKPETDTAFKCLLSLSEQLSASIPGFKVGHAWTQSTEIEDLDKIFDVLIRDPANGVKPLPSCFYVLVLDALDECEEESRLGLLLLIQRRWEREIPDWLGIVLTSRPEDYIPYKLKDFNPITLDTEDEANENDLRTYFKAKLLGVLEDDCDAEEALNIVVERSNGLFLYARFFEDMIENALNPQFAGDEYTKLTIKKLRDTRLFPVGLHGVYQKYFTRFKTSIGKELYRTLLTPIVAAREPLHVETWANLCGYTGEDQITSFREDIEGKARQLLYVANGHVRILHKSMTDFLLDKATPRELRVSKSRGHELLASWCKANLLDRFSLRNAIFHFLNLRDYDLVASRLLDYSWLYLAIVEGSAVVEDFVNDAQAFGIAVSEVEDKTQEIQDAYLVANALRLAGLALRYDRRELGAQLFARLPKDHPISPQILDYHVDGLFPLSRSLTPATSPMRAVLHSHDERVMACASSTDGRFFATASDNLVMWDTSTFKKIFDVKMVDLSPPRVVPPDQDVRDDQQRERHANREAEEILVKEICFSPDSNRVAVGCRKSVLVLKANTGELLQNLQGHEEMVQTVCFAPHSSDARLVSGSRDFTAIVWDLSQDENPRALKELDAHTNGVTKVLFSPNGSRLATSSRDRTIRIWNCMENYALDRVLNFHTSWINSIAFSPTDSNCLVSAAEDGLLQIWNLSTGTCLETPVRAHFEGIKSVAIGVNPFDPSKQVIATGAIDRKVNIFDLHTKERIQVLRGHVFGVNAVTFVTNSSLLISASDGSILVWDVEALKRKTPQLQRRLMNDVEEDADELDHYAVEGEDEEDNEYGDFGEEGFYFCDGVFSSDGALLAVGGLNGHIKIFELGACSVIADHHVHKRFIRCMDFSPDNTLVASSDGDGVLLVAYAHTGEIYRNLPMGDGSTIHSVRFSPLDSNVLLSTTYTRILVWDLQATQEMYRLAGHFALIQDALFSPDAKYIASASRDKTIRIWDTETHAMVKLFRESDDMTKTIAFSPDGMTLAAGNFDGEVLILDLAQWKCTHRLKAGNKPVKDLTFTLDGAYVQCSQDFSPVYSWDTRTYSPSDDDVVPSEHSIFLNVENSVHIKSLNINGVGFTADGKIRRGFLGPQVRDQHSNTSTRYALVVEGRKIHILRNDSD